MQSFLFILLIVQINSTISFSGPTIPEICPKIVTKARWGARTPIEVDYNVIPIEYVVVHHTVTDECETEEECAEMLTSIQNFHMDELEFNDIGYNFIIGGDGNVYEGAGWHKVGAHTRGYNTRSLGIAFIGNFSAKAPKDKQMKALKDFLECAVQLGELDSRYKIFGARQVSATQSPGLKLYHELQKLAHFEKAPPQKIQRNSKR